MSDPFVAEVKIFAGNFAPRGWAFCNGATLPIAQYTALFSLVGTTFGGDGRTTLGLPNLQGRAPMHPGRGPGLTARRLGEKVGAESVTLNSTQIPAHAHNVRGYNQAAPSGTTNASGNVPTISAGRGAPTFYAASSATQVDMAANSFTPTGGGAAHENRQPFLAMYFIIALNGTYPSRP